jgi:hypothetical protein
MLSKETKDFKPGQEIDPTKLSSTYQSLIKEVE